MKSTPLIVKILFALCNQCWWAIKAYRFSHWLFTRGFINTARIVHMLSKWSTSIDIQPSAQIGKKVNITHGLGIVIGDKVQIGNNVIIMQQVTIGTKYIKERYSKDDVPEIEDFVILGTGCKILGGIRIGEGAIIGANAVVVEDIPKYGIAVGIPAHVIKYRQQMQHD